MDNGYHLDIQSMNVLRSLLSPRIYKTSNEDINVIDAQSIDDTILNIDFDSYRAQLRLWQLLHGLIISSYRVKELDYEDYGFSSLITCLKQSIQFVRCFDILITALMMYKYNSIYSVDFNCYRNMYVSFLKKCVLYVKENLEVVRIDMKYIHEICDRVITGVYDMISDFEENMEEGVGAATNDFQCRCSRIVSTNSVVNFAQDFYCNGCGNLVRFCCLSFQFMDYEDDRYLNALSCPICRCEVFVAHSLFPLAFKNSLDVRSITFADREDCRSRVNDLHFVTFFVQLAISILTVQLVSTHPLYYSKSR